MALQTSGQIRLNEIHVEAGGTSGTQTAMNDADNRGLIDAASGSQMKMTDWYGASNTFWEMPFAWTQYASWVNSDGSNFHFTTYNNITDEWFTTDAPNNQINFGFESSHYDNSAANAVVYFGNQSGKTFNITGSAYKSYYDSTPYMIVRGYTSGYLSGSSSDYVLINPAGAVDETFTVSSSYPYLIISFEIHSTAYYSNIGMYLEDLIMVEV